MKNSTLTAICLLISTSFLLSQSQSVVVANASGATITDWGTRTFTQQVIISGNPSNLSVIVELNHTWVADLQLKITNPSGNSAIVFKELGTNPCFGCEGNNMNITFRDGAAITYSELNATCSNNPAYSGQARSLQNLNPLLNGAVNGNWTVEIKDLWPTETGIINSITLVFSGVIITPAIATISLEGDQSIGGDPVQLGTGSFISHYKDFVLQGKNMQLDFTRTYNSLNHEINGPFGNGWSHSYNYRLANYGDFLWDVHYADGHVVSFIPTGDEGQSTPLYSLTKDSLQQNPDLSFSLFTQEMTHYHFDQGGRLDSVIDLNGNAAVLHYTEEALDSIVISGGRKLEINYTDAKISSVTDPLNRTIQYSYDTEGNLIAVTDAENEMTTFEYDPENRLSAIINPLGDTIVTNIYDPVSGKIIEQEDAEGEIMTFLYTAPDPEEDFTGFPESNSALQAFPVHRDVKRRMEAESMKQLKSEEKTESIFENQNRNTIPPDKIENEKARTERFHKKGFYQNLTDETPFATMEVIDISGDFEPGPTFEDKRWTLDNGSFTHQMIPDKAAETITSVKNALYHSTVNQLTNNFSGKNDIQSHSNFGDNQVSLSNLQISGIKNVPGDYADLSAAFSDLNNYGVGEGGLIINIVAGNPQNCPTDGFQLGSTVLNASLSATNTLVIEGNGNTINAWSGTRAGSTSSGQNDGMFVLKGVDYTTAQNMVFQESAANTTNTLSMENAVAFYNLGTTAGSADGCQYNTVTGCTFNLNNLANNGGAIYSAPYAFGGTSAAAWTAGSSDVHRNLTVTNNNFATIYNGVVFRGVSGTNASNLVVSNNTLANIGGGSTTCYGLYTIYTDYITFNNNTASGDVAQTSTNYIAFTSTNCGGVIQANDNQMTIQSGVTSSQVNGIYLSGNIGGNRQVNNNIISFGSFPSITSAALYLIYATYSGSNKNLLLEMNGNQISNQTLPPTTGTIYMIYNSANSGGNKNTQINNNVVTNITKSNSGIVYPVWVGTSDNAEVAYNTISDFTLTNNSASGSALVYGIYASNNALGHNFHHNTISNISITGTSTSTSGVLRGIYSYPASAAAVTIADNLINDLSYGAGTHTGVVTGIYSTYGVTSNIYNNKIYNLKAFQASGLAYGYYGSSGTTVNFFNNFIGDLETPNANAAIPLAGIYIGGGTTFNVYFNTVYLNTSSSGALFGSAALYASTIPTVLLQNNIFTNLSVPTGATGFSSAYRRSGTTLTTYAAGSNNNLFYSGTPSANNVIYYDGTTAQSTMTAYKDLVSSRDALSVTEDPPFISTTGSNAEFLHISIATPTQIESGGIPVAGITDDYDGDVRNGSNPDIGADEGTFLLVDINPPLITYTPLQNSCSAVDVTLIVTISDPSGVPTTGTGLPVLYWSLNSITGPFTASQGTFIGSSQYQFSLGAGSVVGDVVYYYIVAQDMLTVPNIGAFPSAGAGGFTSNPPAAATPPTTPSSYTVIPTLAGTYTVGTLGTYSTISAAVTAFNNSCVSGHVVFSLIDASYSEAAAVVVNSNPASSAVNTLTIKPTMPNTTISVAGGSTSAIFVMNGADYVIIDGSLSGTVNFCCPITTASRDLTISNSSTTTSSAVIWLQTATGPNPATNITIKNCNLTGSGVTQTLFGVGSGSTTISTSSLGTNNNNNSFVNNSISGVQYGIYSQGASAANKNSGTEVSQNLINTTANTKGGIWLGFEYGPMVSCNNVSNIAQSSSPDVFGITLGMGISVSATTSSGNEVTNATVTNNMIGSVVNSGTYSAVGIAVSAATSGTTLIANNMISGVSANGTSGDFSAGIIVGGGTGSITQVYFNTVRMQGTIAGSTAASQTSTCLASTNSTPPVLALKNNIFTNTQIGNASATLRFAAIAMAGSTYTNLMSDYNDLYAAGAGPGNYTVGITGTVVGGTNSVTLTDWQTTTGKDANSLNINPVFVSSTDLHLLGSNPSNFPLFSGGTTIPEIMEDIDCASRSIVAPTIGADEEIYFDIDGPSISYSEFPIFVCIGGQTLSATITDPSTVDSNPGSKPRLWFKKASESNILALSNSSSDAGWKYVEATNDSPPFLFDFDYDLLTSSVVSSDVIEYFVVAQDIIVPPNVGTNQATYSNPPVNVSLGPDVFPVSGVKSFVFFDELTAAVDPSFVCVSDDVNLSLVENPGSDANYQWESSPAGNNTWSSIPGATTASFTVYDVTESTDFRCRVYCGVQESTLSPTNQVSVISGDPQVLSTTPDQVYFPNGPVSMTLGATANAGSTIDWYAAATGGTVLGTGTNFETPLIFESTTFYAEAVDAISGCKSQREPVLAEIFNSSPYRLTIVTNPDNSQTIVFHDEQIRKVNETNELGHAVLYVYDSLSNPIVLTNENNFSVNRSYDSWGNMLSDTLPGNRITLIEYNSFNSPVHITDANGNQKFFFYDPANNNLDSVLMEDGTKILYLYDNSGQITQMTDGKGNITNYTYSDHGDLLSVQTAVGTRHFTYDAAGRKLSETDENGHATTYTYDLNNNVLVVTDPLGKTVESTYDANNQLLSIQDKNGSITYYSYDKKGRKVSSTDPLGKITSYLYDVRNNLISVTDPNNHVVSYTYDAANRKTSMTNALGTTQYTYDAAANLIRVTDPDNRFTDYSYTPTNKKASMTDGMGNLTSYTYDNNDNLISMTDALNRTTGYAYDVMERLVTVTDPAGNETSVSYDAIGNRQTVTDPNGHPISYTYDAANRLISSADAAGNVISYTLDNNGNITSITKPTGTITKTFDALNRIMTVANSTGDNYAFTYDDKGNVLTMTNLTGTSEMEYDSLNRLVLYSDPYGKSVAFEYDDAGNKTSMVYPGNKTVNYSYDGANNLVSVTDWLGKVYTYSYYASGRIKELLYPNEIRCSYTYDQAGRLISRIYYDADSTVLSGSYFDLNPVGNRITEQKFGQQSGVPEDLSRVYAYTADDVMLSDSIWTYTHDLSGNRIAETDGTANVSYTFTVDNLLTGRINANGVNFNYTYNPFGHRLSVAEGANVKRFVVDISTSLSKVLQITDENGEVMADYINGLGLLAQIDSLNNPLYYHFDGQHNTIMLTDDNGEIQDWYTYDPFGTMVTQTGTTEQPFTFLGEYGVVAEATGLYYVRARYYDAVNGRFLSKDMYEFDLNNPQTINRFVYGVSNPLINIDPTGLFSWSSAGIAGLQFVKGVGNLAVGTLGLISSATLGPVLGSASILTAGQSYNEAIKDFKASSANLTNAILDNNEWVLSSDFSGPLDYFYNDPIVDVTTKTASVVLAAHAINSHFHESPKTAQSILKSNWPTTKKMGFLLNYGKGLIKSFPAKSLIDIYSAAEAITDSKKYLSNNESIEKKINNRCPTY